MTQTRKEIPGLLCLDRIVLHNTTTILQQNPLRVKTPTQAWAYAAAFEARHAGFDPESEDGEIEVGVDIRVDDGEVCIGGLTQDLQEFIGVEAVVTPRTGRGLLRVQIPEPHRFRWLMFRKGASSDHPAIFSLHSVRCYWRKGGGAADLFDAPLPEFRNKLTSPRLLPQQS